MSWVTLIVGAVIFSVALLWASQGPVVRRNALVGALNALSIIGGAVGLVMIAFSIAALATMSRF